MHTDAAVDKDITEAIIGAAIEVHRAIGPGCFERSYAVCLAEELRARGISFQAEVAWPIRYRGRLLPHGYRFDFLVEDRVIVELKAVQETLPVHKIQVLTYLRHANRRTGLLLNFNKPTLTEGISRIYNAHQA